MCRPRRRYRKRDLGISGVDAPSIALQSDPRRTARASSQSRAGARPHAHRPEQVCVTTFRHWPGRFLVRRSPREFHRRGDAFRGTALALGGPTASHGPDTRAQVARNSRGRLMANTRTRKATAVTPASSRYDELKQMLDERQRELAAEVQGKIRSVREDGAQKPHERMVLGETSEIDHQDLDLALIQMKAETLNKINEARSRLENTATACASSAATRLPRRGCARCRSRCAARRAKRRGRWRTSGCAPWRDAEESRACSTTCGASSCTALATACHQIESASRI